MWKADDVARGVDGGSERLVKSIQISSRRDLLLRIKGVKYGDSGGTGSYKVALSGAVNVGQGATPVGGGAAPAPAGGAAAPPAANNVLSGQLDPADDRVLFHIVNVNGPGEVTFAFSVKATDAKAGAGFGVESERNYGFSGPRAARR